MDPSIINILLEFLEVAFHSILFVTDIYPKEIFENRKKYGAPVKYSIHPQVNEYIINSLEVIKELLTSGSLERVVLVIFSEKKVENQRFVFEFNDYAHTNASSDQDPYLIKLEQSMRSFCLNLAYMKSSLKLVHETSTFSIEMHTNESTAVNIVRCAEMEHFPVVEKEPNDFCAINNILPIVTINLNGLLIQAFAEQ